MARRFACVPPEASLLEAGALMRDAKIRHLPVVRGEVLVGILSQRDLADAAPPSAPGSELRPLSVGQVMRSDPWTAEESTPIREAAQRMLRYRIGCLPVVRAGPDGPLLVGIVTESDLLRAAYAPASRR
jgi:acetoin utilization protein AcuB